MPQATDELRAMFEDDGAALDVLREHYTVSRGGVISPKDENRPGTARESAAIDYLFQEWDYGFDPRGASLARPEPTARPPRR